MPMILLVVVGAINQSKYVPMMSLVVLGTLTNQILWVYVGLHGGLCGSIKAEVHAGLHGPTWVYAEVYVGLHGSTRGLCRGLHGVIMGNLKFKAYFKVLHPL